MGDLNVIFGRNDSGKSNLLRALSLFFNGNTEPNRHFDFDLDMSDIRKKEARDLKGKQFIWIKITFNTPENYRAALGDEVEVKRQWNRGGEVNQTVWPKSLRSGATAARLTRFLNDIDFTYIPAIKDISVYSDLVERLYGAAAQSIAVSAATDEFVNQIGAANASLIESLQNLFGSKSALSAPTELSQLFRSLDFSYGEEGHSLLRQKGDGVKARHIPELLRSINDGERRKKFYVWGFEEPENSLDLSAATLEAARFANLSSREDTQIFLSSHSPAFYLAEDKNADVRRLFISKQLKFASNIKPENAVKLVQSLEDAEAVMESAGLLHFPFVIRTLKDLPERISILQSDKEELERRLADLDKPTIFFEGAHDLKIIRSRFPGNDELHLREVGGTPSTIPAILKAIVRGGNLVLGSRALMIFDNDPSGRSAMRKITGLNQLNFCEPTEVTGQLFVMCLPYQKCIHFQDFMNHVGLKEDDIIFEGEFLINPTAVAEILAQKEFESQSIHEDYHKKPQSIGNKMREYQPGTPGWLFSRTVPDEFKNEIIGATLSSENNPSLDHLEQVIRTFLS